MTTEPTKTFINEYGYRTEEWRNNDGQRHRDNAPAHITYNQDGTIWKEEYWQDGEHHRIDDPAIIEYNSDGTIKRQEYWQGGKQYTPTTRDVKNTFNTKLEAIKQRNNTKTPVVKHDRKPGRTLS